MKTCEQCGKPYEGKALRFCSRECLYANGHVTATCTVCGKAFEKRKSSPQQICSRSCAAREQFTKPGSNIIKACEHCGKEFIYYPSCNSNRQYCSRECQKTALRITTTCPQCGKEFWYHKTNPRIYCSLKCSAAVNAIANLGEHFQENPPVEVACDNCGKLFHKRHDQYLATKHHFCCQTCLGDWRSIHITGENHPLWNGGYGEWYYGPNWYQQRDKARARDGYCCSGCGISEKKLGRELDVHHLEPFRNYGYVPGENDFYLLANRLENLISLCQSCHKLAEHKVIPVQPHLL